MNPGGTAVSFEQRLTAARQLLASGSSEPRFAAHMQDQIDSAARECHHYAERVGTIVALLEPHRGWRQLTRYDDAEQRAYLLAAMLDCMRNVCPHLRKEGPQPAYAALPLRRLDCRRCAGIRRLPPPEDADRCDVCGSRGVSRFVPFVVSVGPTLVSGDVCPSCAGALGIQERAA